MKIVLDTNIVSALVRGEEAPSARLLALNPEDVAVPQPVVAEIRYGLLRLPLSRRRRALEARVEQLLDALPRVAWTDEVSASFALIKVRLERKGQRLDDFDLAIAAHALALDAALATANVRHLARVPDLRIEDWSVRP